MNRRRRQRLLLAAVIATLVALGLLWLDVRLANRRPVPRSDVQTAARSTTVYVLGDEQWTVFRIPATARRIRLLSHAGVVAAELGADPPPVAYGIRYRLTTLGGDTIDEGEFRYLTGLVDRADESGRPARRAFYDDARVVPASLRRSQIDLATREVLLLALRADGAASPPVSDVAVRVSYKQDVPERKLTYQWARKSTDRRRQLTVSRVHGLTDLTDAERRNLLLTRWSPVGPQGVDGADYRSRAFYYRDDLEEIPPEEDAAEGADMLRCEPGLRATIGVPEAGRIRLRFTACDPAPPVRERVVVRHFGTHLGERARFEHDPFADGEFIAEVPAGMLEIESPTRVLVEVVRDDGAGAAGPGAGWREQLPMSAAPSVVRAWQCGADSGTGAGALAFDVGTGEGGDLVRLACRPSTGSAPRESRLVMQWIAADGAEVLATHERRVASSPSIYDRVVAGGELLPVADPVDVVLRVPERATRLVVRADEGMIVSAFARPGGLVHRTRVPEDYVRGAADPGNRPVWFPLWPPDAEERIRAFRAPLLRLQARPPEDDEDILAGRFEWEDFDPPAGSLGGYLLTERDPSAPGRLEALPSLFMPVAVGAEAATVVPEAAPPGVEAIDRRLAVVRDGDRPAVLRVSTGGGELLAEVALASRAGEFPLPPLPRVAGCPAGLRVAADDPSVRAWINYVDPARATRLKRFAHRFGPGRPLAFRVDKTGGEEEILTATWFAPAGHREPAVIRVAISPVEPVAPPAIAERFTPTEREFVVRAGEGAPVDALGGPVPVLAAGRRVFLPLGSDLPSGEVAIEISMLEGAEGFLILSRVRGGAHTWARFFREDER